MVLCDFSSRNQMSSKTLREFDTKLTSKEAYDSNLFTSKCCHAFNVYNGTTYICSQCNRVINQLKDDETLTISVKFNDTSQTNVSGDIIHAFRVKAKRFALDPTYELCATKCPKCGSYTRYARDPQETIIFICSNPDCREVFDSTEQ